MPVVDLAPGVVEGVLHHQGSVGGRDVDEFSVPGHIPCGPDPGVGAGECALDQDLAGVAGLDADGVQVQSVGDGASAGGYQQLCGAEFLLAPGDRGGDKDLCAGGICADRSYGCAADHADALVGEDAHQRTGGFRFLVRGKPGADQQGHFGSEAGKKLRLLQGHVPAAEDDQGLGHLVQFHGGGRGQVVDFIQSRHRGCPRGRTGRDQIMGGGQGVAGAVGSGDFQDRFLRGAGEHRGALAQVPSVVGGQIHVFIRAHSLDQGAFPVYQYTHVHRGGGSADPGEPSGRIHSDMPGFGGGQQGFGGNAPGVHTGPAHRGAFDHHDPPIAQLGGPDGGGEGAASGTDHG